MVKAIVLTINDDDDDDDNDNDVNGDVHDDRQC